MFEVTIATMNTPSADSLALEVVERKGLGHPDTLCDALAETLSQTLCQYYIKHFGFILHHNVDKVLLCGGASHAVFGGGEVTTPIEIFLAGRATSEYKGKKVPVEALVRESCRNWLRNHFHALDPDRHVKLHSLIRPGSIELVDLYFRQEQTGVAMANDTSCGVGYAPLDDLERVVLNVEALLNSASIKKAQPAIGEDIKVMGVRRANSIQLTLACAFIDRYVSDVDDYMDKKTQVSALALQAARQVTAMEVTADVNTADDSHKGGLYLTVTGTSAEAGDDGEVGRGNRANGLITPYRPMNMEAAAGKNPVTHVGKIYNVVAQQITNTLVRELPEIEEAYCYLVSRIGHPVHEPQVADLHVRLTAGVSLTTVQAAVREIFHAQFNQLKSLRQALVNGTIKVY